MHENAIASQTMSLRSAADMQDILRAAEDYQLTVTHPGGVWALPEDACKFVGSLVRHLRPKRVLEFGSGLSSTIIATELKRVPGAQLISVDHHRVFQAKARRLAEEHHVSDVIQFHRCPIRPVWYTASCCFSMTSRLDFRDNSRIWIWCS